MSNDIITIKEATQKQAGPSLKFSYVDTNGKTWCSWEPLQLVAGKTYELQKIETKKWASKQNPDREFTDYVIKGVKEVAGPVAIDKQQIAANNGKAQPFQNGRQKWDKDEVLSARLSLIIGGWAQSGQIALDGQSVARALWALENGLAIYNAGPFPLAKDQPANNSEDPGDGMEGTEFGR